jgi:hypothetical protein
LAAEEGQASAAALLPQADTILALSADAPAVDALLARADLAVTCSGPAELARPQMCLAADGRVAQAPWSR